MKLKDMAPEMRLILVGMIVANTSTMMFIPFLPLYLENLGATVAQVGVFFTMMTVLGITFRVLGGWVSDNLGRLETIGIGGGLLLWLFLIDGLLDSGFQMTLPYLPKYVTEVGGLDETVYGGLFALSSLVAALAMWPGGIIADRYTEPAAITVGTLLLGLIWTIVAVRPTLIGFVVTFALTGVAMALIGPAFSSLLSKAVPKASLGITFGIFWTALGVVAIPAPYIGGMLYDNSGPQTPFVAAALIVVVAIPLILWKLRLPPDIAYGGLSARDTGSMMAVSVNTSGEKRATGSLAALDLTATIDGE